MNKPHSLLQISIHGTDGSLSLSLSLSRLSHCTIQLLSNAS